MQSVKNTLLSVLFVLLLTLVESEKVCSTSEFVCGNGKCIPLSWICDGSNDCENGRDEDRDVCKSTNHTSCNPSDFVCEDKTCIPAMWVCDNEADCSDGSDESVKNCGEKCPNGKFICDNGNCVDENYRCDGDNDCKDNSDEKDCPPVTCNEKEFLCGNGTCIAKNWVCDGDVDCPHDNADEKDCPPLVGNSTLCSENQISCGDGVNCIHKAWMCDGDNDCSDGSDELAEFCPEKTCREDQFRCNDGNCIPGHLQCSGDAECVDKSDEENCLVEHTKCNKDKEFDCGDEVCIPLDRTCDGVRDCSNGSDEPVDKCHVNECKIKNGGCSHICVDTPASFYCRCHPGYELKNGNLCSDINECELPGTCSQICVNTEGSFKCKCEEGYRIDPLNHHNCKATDGHASLLFSHKTDIRKISLDLHEMTTVVNSTQSASGLDYIFKTGFVFWCDLMSKKIYKAPIDEGSKSEVVSRKPVSSDGIAVDWIYMHLYWVDKIKNTIEVSELDGSMNKVLLKDSKGQPRCIVVNPLDGWMYWSDWGFKAKIERAGMDGSHRSILVDQNIIWPNSLTLDFVQKRLYWIDAKLNVVYSVLYNGDERRMVLHSPDLVKHPFSITVFESWIYWTDWDREAILKANKFTGENASSITASPWVRHPMTVKVYHPYRQPDGDNHCAPLNGRCSHLCLPAPQFNSRSPKYSCACPDGLKLISNGLTCISGNEIEITDTTVANVKNTTTHSGQPSTVDQTEFTPEASSTTLTIVAIVITVFILVVIVIGVLIYFHCARKHPRNFNFDNPVYRKTTEDQFSIDKNLYQPTRTFPPTIREETLEPLTHPSTNEYV